MKFIEDIKEKYFAIILRFKELIQERIVQYAIILHLFYFILAIILVLTVFRNQNDFLVFFQAAEIFITDINNLYDQSKYLWDFRYLPLSAIYFVPFYYFGFELGFILFQLTSFLFNILTSIYLYKIIIKIKGPNHENDDKRVILYTCAFLMGIPHVFNYACGQINSLIAFVIIFSLYIFLINRNLKWEIIGGLLLGIGIIIKPIIVITLPFIIIIHYQSESKSLKLNLSKTAARMIGVLIPVFSNLILFLFFPKMLEGFLETNLSGGNSANINFSFSLTKLIINFCIFFELDFNHILILIIILSILFFIGFFTFLLGNFGDNQLIFGYTLSILIMLLGYYDSWDHHLIFFTPLLIIIIFILPRRSQITKDFIYPNFIFISFFDLLCMGLWFLIQDVFPFNFASTIALLLIFLGIIKKGFEKIKSKEFIDEV